MPTFKYAFGILVDGTVRGDRLYFSRNCGCHSDIPPVQLEMNYCQSIEVHLRVASCEGMDLRPW